MGSIDVVQVSDLHINTGGTLHGTDPRAAFDRVVADVVARGLTPDLVVATGDLADDGEREAYRWLGRRFADLGAAVWCLAGNHDRARPFERYLPRAGVHCSGLVDLDDWLFVLLDTNANGRVVSPIGTVHDRDDRRHAARAAAMLDADVSWFEGVLADAGDTPVMVWMHQPVVAHPRFAGLDDRPFARWFVETVGAAGCVRGVSAGHVHSSHAADRSGVRYYTCPSSWLALDLDHGTLAPPGYRHFRFHADGTHESSTYWVDDGQGPERRPFPDWVLTVLAEGG